MIPVILSGGVGSRLWPLSRAQYPKQFLSLHTENTLFQDTALRFIEVTGNAPIVVCNQEHRFIVAENLREKDLEASEIILEPCGRNTAPAIAAACLQALKVEKDPILWVVPADHHIKEIEALKAALPTIEAQAEKGMIITFGIKPTENHTGYGYIKKGKALPKSDDAYQVAQFTEKPDAKTAEKFVKSGEYFWNSGMFCFKASAFLAELKKHHPEILKTVTQSIDRAKEDLDFLRLDEESFSQSTDISIDYAVMEKTSKAAVIALDITWNDIGAWDSVWDVSEKDAHGNAARGNGETIIENAQNNYVYSSNKLVALCGVDDLVVVDTQDALLVASKDKAQDIKNIVSTLKANDRSEAAHHRTVYRPWGHYDSICMGERDQVKRITVKPGAKLSIQKHFHRAEHWVVVKGTAQVTKGEETLLLSENESVYLPLGVIHALENPGKIPLQIIEVQTGSYLGEDDIVRFEDLYGRA